MLSNDQSHFPLQPWCRMANPEGSEAVTIATRFFEARRGRQRLTVEQLLRELPGRNDAATREAALREITHALQERGWPSAEQPGRDFGAPAEIPELEGYDIIDCVGAGGMGFVCEAYSRATGRRVAIKFMLERALHAESGRRRFEREVELVARLAHPRIVSVLDSGVHQGRYFYVMDFVEGQGLREACPPGTCAVSSLLETIVKIAGAVDYAHQRGVLHRDLKPGNIIVDERGEPHLLDFGLAKAMDDVDVGRATISQPGQLLGTFAYMSPEQARGDVAQISVRSDVYSLGAMTYELLTGQLPVSANGPITSIVHAISEQMPPPPSRFRAHVPRDVDAILLKALEKEPQRRYATAGEFAADIERFLAHRPIRARRAGPITIATRWVRRHRAIASVCASAVLALGALVGLQIAKAVIGERHEQQLRRFRLEYFGASSAGSEDWPEVHNLGRLDLAAAHVDDELADDPLGRAQVHHVLAANYERLSCYPRAIEEAQLAVDLRTTAAGPRSPLTAASLYMLALAQQQYSMWSEAESNYKKALDIRQHGDPLERAETLNNLGWLLKDRGRPEEAERLLKDALDLRLSVCGEAPNPMVAETLNDLGQFYLKCRDLSKARDHLQRAWEMRNKLAAGRSTREEAASMCGLGEALWRLRELDKAEPMLRGSLEMRKALGLPEDSDDVLVSRNQIASLLLARGQFAQAEQEYRDVLEVRLSKSGAPQKQTAVALSNLGWCIECQGRYDEAATLYQRALDMDRALAAETDIVFDLNKLAAVCLVLNHADDASKFALEAQQRLNASKDAHTETLKAENQQAIGELSALRGDASAGRTQLERSIALWKSKYGENDWRTARAEVGLARCLIQLGESDSARAHIEHAQSVFSNSSEGSRFLPEANAALATLPQPAP